MHLLINVSFILCKALTTINGSQNSIEGLRERIKEAVFHTEDVTTVSVENDGREFEFEQDEIEQIAFTSQLLNSYSAPIFDEENYEIFQRIEKLTEEENLKEGRTSFGILFVDKENISKINNLNKDIKLFLSTDMNLAKKLNTPFPGIYGYNSNDRVTYQLTVKDEYSKVLLSVIKPLFGLITNESVHLYENTEMVTFYILTKKEKFSETQSEFLALTKEFKNEIQFCLMVYNEKSTNIKAFGLSEQDLPAAIIVHENKKFSVKKITPSNLRDYVLDFKDNKVKEYLMSQEETPEDEKLPLKKIVFNNKDKYLKDVTKDKLVVFETNWCGFCKTLKPVLNELGKLFENERNVMIGAYDMSENEPLNEYIVKGFPTICLIKGETNEVIYFENNERSLKNIVEFIKNGHFKVDLTDKVPKEEVLKEEVKEEISELGEDDYEESVIDEKEDL